jgi:transposase InsO family protein
MASRAATGSFEIGSYIKLDGAFVHLAAILDLYSRKVLAWRLSNTADADFCVEALKEAIEVYGVPEIFNTDQGSQSRGNLGRSCVERWSFRSRRLNYLRRSGTCYCLFGPGESRLLQWVFQRDC